MYYIDILKLEEKIKHNTYVCNNIDIRLIQKRSIFRIACIENHQIGHE